MDKQPKETNCSQAFLPSSQNSPHEDIQTEEIFDCSCQDCSDEIISKENVDPRVEDQNSAVNWDLTCEICSQSYRCLVGLSNHMSSQHPNKISCPLCPLLAQDLAGFNAHMLAHSLTPPVPTGPSNCMPENFANFKAQTPKSTCQESAEEFENSSLTFHAATEDEEIPKRASNNHEFCCGNCSLTFTSKSGLRRHDKNECKSSNLGGQSLTNSREKSFKCLNFGCDYKGRRLYHLQLHQRSCRGRIPIPAPVETSDEISIVDGQPQYNCSICTFSSKFRSQLKKHLMVHTSQKPFRCPIQGCNFQTKWPNNVKIHSRSAHHIETPQKPRQTQENLGPVMDYQTENEVDVSSSSMAYACMLCSFIGDSELSASEHARQHTALNTPLEPNY